MNPSINSGILAVPEIHVRFVRGRVLLDLSHDVLALTFIALHFGCQWGWRCPRKKGEKIEQEKEGRYALEENEHGRKLDLS